MKNIFFATLLLIAPLASAKDFNLVPGDDSAFTQICIAAVDSDRAVDAKLQAHGLDQDDIRDLNCNGLSLSRFAAKHNSAAYDAPVKVFAFQGAETTDETNLCIAAATSNEAYTQVKSEVFSTATQYVLNSIECNDMPLRVFARKYGNAEFRI